MGIRLSILFGAVMLASLSLAQGTPEQQTGLRPTRNLEQMPSGPTIVTYYQGSLKVQAQNAVLSDVLHAVAARIGALIDIPRGADERVAVSVGPGPVREVIASLLNGSNFNYLFVGSPNDPGSALRIVLSHRPASKIDDEMHTQVADAGQKQPIGVPGETKTQPIANSEPVPSQDQVRVQPPVESQAATEVPVDAQQQAAGQPQAVTEAQPVVEPQPVAETQPVAEPQAQIASPSTVPADSSTKVSSPGAGDGASSGSFLRRLRRQKHVRPSAPR